MFSRAVSGALWRLLGGAERALQEPVQSADRVEPGGRGVRHGGL